MVIFNENLVNVAKNYLKKGSKVYVEGQLQTRKWVDNTGVEKYSTEVVLQSFNAVLVMLDGRRDGGEGASHGDHAPAASAPRAAAPANNAPLDDEIPF